LLQKNKGKKAKGIKKGIQKETATAEGYKSPINPGRRYHRKKAKIGRGVPHLSPTLNQPEGTQEKPK